MPTIFALLVSHYFSCTTWSNWLTFIKERNNSSVRFNTKYKKTSIDSMQYIPYITISRKTL